MSCTLSFSFCRSSGDMLSRAETGSNDVEREVCCPGDPKEPIVVLFINPSDAKESMNAVLPGCPAVPGGSGRAGGPALHSSIIGSPPYEIWFASVWSFCKQQHDKARLIAVSITFC
eukprot:CAMPEP_0172714082 /NCGR_PEP_ID=MMETSP1074-20121228/64685_1 /TAXON_ID=2916 /ORGANISM="Ceratium fusus, Strain PA161109" /LENGTH=115 /DNA_ID=CAMNT_0013538397 /DNA_START=444 /DNA_END=791 /DNA_ORIENTATION=+